MQYLVPLEPFRHVFYYIAVQEVSDPREVISSNLIEVTRTGTAGAGTATVDVVIKVPEDAESWPPTTIYYECGNHAGMGGEIQIDNTANGFLHKVVEQGDIGKNVTK